MGCPYKLEPLSERLKALSDKEFRSLLYFYSYDYVKLNERNETMEFKAINNEAVRRGIIYFDKEFKVGYERSEK